MVTISWGNVEKTIIAYLKQKTGLPGYSRTKGTMPDVYFTVRRTGGTLVWIDREVDIEIVVSTKDSRSHMWNLADIVESSMFDLAANTTGDLYVDNVDEPFAFADDPPDDPNINQATATFTLTIRPL